MLSTYEPWEDYELTFLCETYPSKDWSVLQIAQKLDRSINGIHQKAFALEIKRPNRTFAHRHSPDFIVDIKTDQRINTIIAKWGCSKAEVDRGRARLRAMEAAA